MTFKAKSVHAMITLFLMLSVTISCNLEAKSPAKGAFIEIKTKNHKLTAGELLVVNELGLVIIDSEMSQTIGWPEINEIKVIRKAKQRIAGILLILGGVAGIALGNIIADNSLNPSGSFIDWSSLERGGIILGSFCGGVTLGGILGLLADYRSPIFCRPGNPDPNTIQELCRLLAPYSRREVESIGQSAGEEKK